MLAISIAGISWAHKLRVGYKLATLSIFSIFIFYVNSLFLLLLILFGILLLYYSVSIAVLRKGNSSTSSFNSGNRLNMDFSYNPRRIFVWNSYMPQIDYFICTSKFCNFIIKTF